MTPVLLANVAAWSLQVSAIVGAGLIALWLLRLEAPAVRYGFLRVLLAICLMLPLVQPRVAVRADAEGGIAGGMVAVAPGEAGGEPDSAGKNTLPAWPAAVGTAIAAGA